jgi:diacylglycerol kinase (ATP)
MRRAMLFYNPHSGPKRGNPRPIIERVANVLREAGVEVSVAETVSSAEAGSQARAAVAAGCDTIFACGGDGTIQDLAQGLVGTSVALAIIPRGTANVLAHDLGLPHDPVAAARVALRAVPLRIAVGQIACQSVRNTDSDDAESLLVRRYFLCVAGAGLDGYLFNHVAPSEKRTLGISIYFAKALRVWLLHKMEWFTADVSSTNAKDRQPVTQVLAVRLHDFGNLLRDLAPGASLLRDDLRVVLFQTSSRWSYLSYVVRGILGGKWHVPGITICDAKAITLAPAEASPIYIEADGELLGTLPAQISIIPDALTLLVPPSFAAR